MSLVFWLLIAVSKEESFDNMNIVKKYIKMGKCVCLFRDASAYDEKMMKDIFQLVSLI